MSYFETTLPHTYKPTAYPCFCHYLYLKLRLKAQSLLGSWKGFARLVLLFMPPNTPLGKHRKRKRQRGWDADRWHSRWDSPSVVGVGHKESEWAKKWMERDAEMGIKVQAWGRFAAISWQKITSKNLSSSRLLLCAYLFNSEHIFFV